MNLRLQLAFLFLVAACAAADTRQEDALRDFIELAELQEHDKVRTDGRDRWEVINEHFVIYKARRQDYLFEFRSACYDLVEDNVVADKRWNSRTIQARFDTFNGCRINRIYSLAEGQAAEVTELSEATK